MYKKKYVYNIVFELYSYILNLLGNNFIGKMKGGKGSKRALDCTKAEFLSTIMGNVNG